MGLLDTIKSWLDRGDVQRKIRTRTMGFLLVTLVALGGAPASGGNKNAASQSLGKPDLVVTPAEWRADFKKDSQAAKAKYKGKVIEMSGTVTSARPNPFGEPYGYVNLDVANDVEGVRCLVADTKPWTKVSPGSKVKVRGKSSEVISGDLNPCAIIEAGPNPGVVVSAHELAKQFAADRKEARKKYDEKWAYVKGEVIERTSSEFCPVLLKLKGAGDATVNLCVGANHNFMYGVQVGSKVDVFGQLDVPDGAQEKAVSFRMFYVTDVK